MLYRILSKLETTQVKFTKQKTMNYGGLKQDTKYDGLK